MRIKFVRLPPVPATVLPHHGRCCKQTKPSFPGIGHQEFCHSNENLVYKDLKTEIIQVYWNFKYPLTKDSTEKSLRMEEEDF